MFCGLFRNNTEKIAVIFGEKNQFCIVYFNLNKMWIFFKKKGAYSFPCRGCSPPLLGLLLGIWGFFEAIVNGIVFINSFSFCSLLSV
jgi:hypothetical protein